MQRHFQNHQSEEKRCIPQDSPETPDGIVQGRPVWFCLCLLLPFHPPLTPPPWYFSACIRNILAYFPSRSISSLWLPDSMILPFSSI